jgi:hypothetical protein
MEKNPPKSTKRASDSEIVLLEKALTHFVKTFEESAQRWEGTVYPFIQSFEESTKRWERMVYPAIIVIGMLGISGFWLIYSLTKDIHDLTASIDPKMEHNMAVIAEQVSYMSNSVDQMTLEVATMSADMSDMNMNMTSLPRMEEQMNTMNETIHVIQYHTGAMNATMNRLNYSVGRPMSKMDDVIPW